MRLIDAESLFRFLNYQRVKETGAFSKGLNKGINIARGAVRNEEICPTVDAVPVVRCKDCKHFDENNACFCHAADENGTPIFVREHDFCSYGERKNDGICKED